MRDRMRDSRTRVWRRSQDQESHVVDKEIRDLESRANERTRKRRLWNPELDGSESRFQKLRDLEI